MSEEQLKETIAHLRSELEHEREERNYFQLERDKINTFWEITKKVRAAPAAPRSRATLPPPRCPSPPNRSSRIGSVHREELRGRWRRRW